MVYKESVYSENKIQSVHANDYNPHFREALPTRYWLIPSNVRSWQFKFLTFSEKARKTWKSYMYINSSSQLVSEEVFISVFIFRNIAVELTTN